MVGYVSPKSLGATVIQVGGGLKNHKYKWDYSENVFTVRRGCGWMSKEHWHWKTEKENKLMKRN